MDPFWGVVIGSAIGALLVEIFHLIKLHKIRPDSPGYAIASIIIGILFFIPMICVIGMTLGIISFKKTKHRTISVIGIIMNSIVTVFWIIVILERIF